MIQSLQQEKVKEFCIFCADVGRHAKKDSGMSCSRSMQYKSINCVFEVYMNYYYFFDSSRERETEHTSFRGCLVLVVVSLSLPKKSVEHEERRRKSR